MEETAHLYEEEDDGDTKNRGQNIENRKVELCTCGMITWCLKYSYMDLSTIPGGV